MSIDLGDLMRERAALVEATVRDGRVTEVRRRIGPGGAGRPERPSLPSSWSPRLRRA